MKNIPKAFATLSLFLPITLWASNDTVFDKQHATVQSTLYNVSNQLDGWFGTPDPNKPASANIRVMLDNQWNHYDGYSIKPRVRAKIKLPGLKRRLSLVIGDEDLDNQARDKNQTRSTYREPLERDKHYDRRQARNDNASVAVRWSDEIRSLGIDTDFDVGVRSGLDVFGRLKLSKKWQYSEAFSTRLEQIYRYGSNSKHFLRTNLENKFVENENTFVNNHTYLEYTHDLKEKLTLGNSLYRQHNFANYKQLNYGLSIGGEVKHKKLDIVHYGPFINWRQPILREWVFIQPELTFYNNKKLKRHHHLGVFLRVEAIF